jgi:hypothetical protein
MQVAHPSFFSPFRGERGFASLAPKGAGKKKRSFAIPNRRRERLGYIKGAEMVFFSMLTSR